MRRGAVGIVEGIACGGALGRRLLELGFTQGTRISLVRADGLGVVFALRGYSVMLAASDAANIRVKGDSCGGCGACG